MVHAGNCKVEPVSRAIDVMHLDRDRVICAYEVDGLVIDPGPESCSQVLLDGLDPVEPRALLLTHIHLDHAGATGALAQRFPDMPIYVHERGAPHLVDPAKLIRSARRLYGDDLGLLWGEIIPVPEEQVRPLRGGEVVEGFRVAETLGHASHHVSYLHEDSGDAYVGDMAGVRVPPFEHTIAPTPPPDIDVEGWLDSLHVIAGWSPHRLCLTHFGPVTDVEEQLHRARTAVLDQAERARNAGEDEFIAWIEDAARAAIDDEDAFQSIEQAAQPNTLYGGLERYWRKKAETEAA
jgi:glyoxylase-like metal-dependent hydrolase (beta-lactamase superfamily II)